MGYRKLCEKCGWYAVTEQTCVCGGSTCCEYTRILKERDVYFNLVLAVFDHKPTSYIEALARDIVSKFEGWFWMKHCENENGICASCFAKLASRHKHPRDAHDALLAAANAYDRLKKGLRRVNEALRERGMLAGRDELRELIEEHEKTKGESACTGQKLG